MFVVIKIMFDRFSSLTYVDFASCSEFFNLQLIVKEVPDEFISDFKF